MSRTNTSSSRGKLDVKSFISSVQKKKAPKPKKSDLPVDVTLTTIFALYPERLSKVTQDELGHYLKSNSTFAHQVASIRAKKSYHMKMASAD